MERVIKAGSRLIRVGMALIRTRSPLLTALLLLRAAAFAGPPEKPVLTEPSRHEALFKIYAWTEGGFTANIDSPNDHKNFG